MLYYRLEVYYREGSKHYSIGEVELDVEPGVVESSDGSCDNDVKYFTTWEEMGDYIEANP